MARGDTSLDSHEYDDWLAENKKERELQRRHAERKSKGYKGWHFGIDDKPIFTKDKDAFKKELEKRGLVMRDDVKRDLR